MYYVLNLAWPLELIQPLTLRLTLTPSLHQGSARMHYEGGGMVRGAIGGTRIRQGCINRGGVMVRGAIGGTRVWQGCIELDLEAFRLSCRVWL